MAFLKDYKQFDGSQLETGPLANVLAYQGVKAPHTGKPLSEAMLFGISGGVVMGYFVFEYKGMAPHLTILTRNSFDPMQTILKRLGIPTQVKQTPNPQKGVENLTAALETGKPVIMWGDYLSLSYAHQPPRKDMWFMFPFVVYGYDEKKGEVYIADRATVPLVATTKTLAAARARTATNKHKLMTLGAPDMKKLNAAVEAGLRDCARNFLGEPPLKPMKGKFGLDGFKRWADLLLDDKTKTGWGKQFPPGANMLAGLASIHRSIQVWPTSGNASRDEYAAFLDEAAALFNKPALKGAAKSFRASAKLWGELAKASLPDSVPMLKEMRQLIEKEYALFAEKGAASLAERKKAYERIQKLEADAKKKFPLSAAEAAALRQDLAARVMKIHDAEREAAEALQGAIA